ncbi:hypothetical protein FHT60_001503 [Novosphingobium sp. BK486]|nr:hypothetical protein [Novosphingobium sp. BK256]MBB3374061.1 hypothetical protein [Novosphingobium sp. BK280]MBB3378473.1 hypothetical protein [Novosphingobium sp. BK258]MBB3419743.1 hypothetical protein [Novosphingobium sp. BK267]MBB3447936.1 hypothetical protein [Novosphingobium sp. BK352]MBB3477342.1 hypothetical protein [Novosphingobium sp. BK369]MBB3500225.1 hypothetical protein [Novosphingobium sp. BK336]MBB3536433.1 hypothetical protein [Novosphingobium sp. BK486]MBB3555406.1 hypo
MPQADQPAGGIGRQAHTLPRFGAAHHGLEHLLPAHHHAHRAAQFTRGDCSRDRFMGDAQLGAETATNIGCDDPHLVGREAQAVGNFLHVVGQHLIAAVQDQAVALPLRDRGVGLHRGAGVAGGVVFHVDGKGRVAHRLVKVTALNRLAAGWRFHLHTRRGRIERHGIAVGVGIVDRQGQGSVARLLKGLRHHQRHGLAKIFHFRRILLRRLGRHALRRAPRHRRIGDYRDHAVARQHLVAVDLADLALGNAGQHQHAFDAAIDAPFGGIGRRAADLERPFGAIERLADHALTHMVEQVAFVGLVIHV